MLILNTVNESDGRDMRVRVRVDELLSSFAFSFFSLGFPTVMYFSVFDDFIFEIFPFAIFAFEIFQSILPDNISVSVPLSFVHGKNQLCRMY